MKIISKDSKIAAVFWDPSNNRKLIEDLRCTRKVDMKAWKENLYGKNLTLGFDVCK